MMNHLQQFGYTSSVKKECFVVGPIAFNPLQGKEL